MRERARGQVKAMSIGGTERDTLHRHIKTHEVSGASVYMGDRCGRAVQDCGHYSVCYSAKEFVNGMVHTNGTELVLAVMKRGFTARHNWSMKHCRRYVDEATFCLNDDNRERDALSVRVRRGGTALEQSARAASRSQRSRLRRPLYAFGSHLTPAQEPHVGAAVGAERP